MPEQKEASTVSHSLVGHTAMDPERPKDLEEDFEAAVVREIVKKRGNTWVIYDDDTGVEIGSYGDRATAWEKQRQHRDQSRAQKKSTAAANKIKRKLNRKKKKKVTREDFLQQIVGSLLRENMVSYVFEQSPTSEADQGWDELVGRISNETLQSDPKLKGLIDAVRKAQVKILNKAANAIKKTLESTKAFVVRDVKAAKGPDGALSVSLQVQMKESQKTLPFLINVQHNKPVIAFPENSKAELNAMATDESKLLRAELLHAQETQLDHMDDIVKAASKRNNYLGDMEKQLDKMVGGMVPLEIALLKNLLKVKYKGMK
jgi:uncharacterized protein (DUF2132 family)